RSRPADPASGLSGPGVPIRRGRITWAGLGFSDVGEYRYWLRSVNRNTTGKGTVPNGAATRHARGRRWRGHVVCRVRRRRGRADHRTRGDRPTLTAARHGGLAPGGDTELSDEDEWG